MGLEANLDGSNNINLDDYCDFDNKTEKKIRTGKLQEKDVTIEILFPEFCNLFGDISNMKYLKKCLPQANFIETAFDEEPAFQSKKVNMIYMGPMTEKTQEKIIKKLQPYTEKIKKMIEENVVFLLTGNSSEIFGNYIENEDGSKIEGLQIFNTYAKRNMMNRHNSLFVGNFEDTKIVGFRSQFTFAYGDNQDCYFASVKKGIGLNPDSKLEGIRINNCMATYVIGPILVLNPEFTKKLIKMLGISNPQIAFEEDVKKAYNQRLKELEAL